MMGPNITPLQMTGLRPHSRAVVGRDGHPGPARAHQALSLQLVKTAELDPSQNYVAGFHPHGIMVAGAFLNLCTESTGFSALFPGIRPYPMTLPLPFRIPFLRDYFMSLGEPGARQGRCRAGCPRGRALPAHAQWEGGARGAAPAAARGRELGESWEEGQGSGLSSGDPVGTAGELHPEAAAPSSPPRAGHVRQGERRARAEQEGGREPPGHRGGGRPGDARRQARRLHAGAAAPQGLRQARAGARVPALRRGDCTDSVLVGDVPARFQMPREVSTSGNSVVRGAGWEGTCSPKLTLDLRPLGSGRMRCAAHSKAVRPWAKPH